MMAAVVLGALQYLSDDAAPDKSIAVLPFASMTTDPDGEIFADGLTDELSHRLARLGDLKVTGRTSSFYFKGRNDELRTIGKSLNVTWILEGKIMTTFASLVKTLPVRVDTGSKAVHICDFPTAARILLSTCFAPRISVSGIIIKM